MPDFTPAETIIATRKEAELTREQAAALIGTSYDTWKCWENGRRRMPTAKYKAFVYACLVLGAERDEQRAREEEAKAATPEAAAQASQRKIDATVAKQVAWKLQSASSAPQAPSAPAAVPWARNKYDAKPYPDDFVGPRMPSDFAFRTVKEAADWYEKYNDEQRKASLVQELGYDPDNVGIRAEDLLDVRDTPVDTLMAQRAEQSRLEAEERTRQALAD